MAQPHEIETLRLMALEEQHSANYEGREASRKILNELGSIVIDSLAPALCITPTAYYLDFDPVTGYQYEALSMHHPVVGGFGGFIAITEEHDFKQEGKVQVQKIGYFIANSPNKRTGYFCPVDSAKLIDVVDTLGPEDELSNDIHVAAKAEDPEIVDELVGIAKRIGVRNPNFHLYAALIRASIDPAEFLKEVTCSGFYMINAQREDASYCDDNISSFINKGDYLQLIAFGSPEPQILLRKGRYHPLALSLSSIIGYELA